MSNQHHAKTQPRLGFWTIFGLQPFIAAEIAGRGAKSALIEQHLAGGDCLNVGCVPSKALLRCARAVHELRRLDLGCASEAKLDFGKVMERNMDEI